MSSALPPGRPRRYNPPPNWPVPPPGWTPPPEWQPDPSWPPPPAGWQLWTDWPPAGQLTRQMTVPLGTKPSPSGRNRSQRLSTGHKVLAIVGASVGALVVLSLIVNAVDPSPASNNSAASPSGGTSTATLPSATAPVATPSAAPAPRTAMSSASAISSATAMTSPSPRVTTTAPKTVPRPSTAPPTHVAPATAAAHSCYPLTNGGNCYEPGEFCRKSDHGAHGVAGDGKAIACEDNNGWRWEPV
jgi:hypothetical protein